MANVPYQLRKYATDMAMGYNLAAAQGKLLRAAADEIERLRAELQAIMDSHERGKNSAYLAEIARLALPTGGRNG